MKKLFLILLVAIVLLASTTGCWNRREVNDLALAVAIGIDKAEDKDYKVSIQLLNPSENASSSGGGYDSPVTTYTSTGKIPFEALRKAIQQTPRKIYLSHLRMIVLGEELAKEGIYDPLDFLSRDHEMRTDFYIVVAREHTAEEVVRTLTSIDKIPANKLFNSLEASAEAWAATGIVTLNDLMDDIVSEGTQPVLTGLTIKGEAKTGQTKDNVETTTPSAMPTYHGMAAFREHKLVGWLNENESKGLNYIKDNVKNTVIVVDMNEGQVGIELFDVKADVKPNFNKDIPSIEISIKAEGNVADVNTRLDLMTASTFSELQNKANKEIEKVIMDAVNKAQKEYKSDIFGLGEKIHKSNPKEWNEIKHKWAELFPEVTVNAKPNVELRRIGTITESFHNELKEE